jgi:hypothetical protein
MYVLRSRQIMLAPETHYITQLDMQANSPPTPHLKKKKINTIFSNEQFFNKQEVYRRSIRYIQLNTLLI